MTSEPRVVLPLVVGAVHVLEQLRLELLGGQVRLVAAGQLSTTSSTVTPTG